jgi:hypothetical protein
MDPRANNSFTLLAAPLFAFGPNYASLLSFDQSLQDSDECYDGTHGCNQTCVDGWYAVLYSVAKTLICQEAAVWVHVRVRGRLLPPGRPAQLLAALRSQLEFIADCWSWYDVN